MLETTQFDTDNLFMQRCLDLASLASVSVAPNPMVGCVITHNNCIIGEGYHHYFGGPHAEVNAFNSVKEPFLLSESSVYVSLEPCSHTGKTPPCVDLLIKHRVKRVVIACQDPNELVAGKGISLLRAAGIEVTFGVLEREATLLNKRFFTYHLKKRPYVTLKWAQTIDGFIDKERTDSSQREINWISCPETQALIHHWRGEEQAILVGWKTVEHDNPSLTVREVSGENPLRIIIDSQLQMPLISKVYSDGDKTIVINKLKDAYVGNVQLLKLTQINTKTILAALYNMGINSVFVEGGSGTLQHFLIDGLWDETRLIVGNTKFNIGLKAPRMYGVPAKTYSFASDTIHHYYK